MDQKREPLDLLHRLMMQFDQYEDLDEHPIRESQQYKDAEEALGWNVDWDKVYDSY